MTGRAGGRLSRDRGLSKGGIRVEAGLCEVCGSRTPDPGRLLCDGCLAHQEYHMEADHPPTSRRAGREGPLRALTPAELEELAHGEPGWGPEEQ